MLIGKTPRAWEIAYAPRCDGDSISKMHKNVKHFLEVYLVGPNQRYESCRIPNAYSTKRMLR